jgi:hypothetical protein
LHQLTRRPLRLAAAVAMLTLALVAVLIALPRDQATATPPSGIAAQLTLDRAKGCRSRTFSAGQTFLEFGPQDVNLTRNETGAVTETVVTFLLPVGAPITIDAPAPSHCRL